jgi:hypothetical protein
LLILGKIAQPYAVLKNFDALGSDRKPSVALDAALDRSTRSPSVAGADEPDEQDIPPKANDKTANDKTVQTVWRASIMCDLLIDVDRTILEAAWISGLAASDLA